MMLLIIGSFMRSNQFNDMGKKLTLIHLPTLNQHIYTSEAPRDMRKSSLLLNFVMPNTNPIDDVIGYWFMHEK